MFRCATPDYPHCWPTSHWGRTARRAQAATCSVTRSAWYVSIQVFWQTPVQLYIVFSGSNAGRSCTTSRAASDSDLGRESSIELAQNADNEDLDDAFSYQGVNDAPDNSMDQSESVGHSDSDIDLAPSPSPDPPATPARGTCSRDNNSTLTNQRGPRLDPTPAGHKRQVSGTAPTGGTPKALKIDGHNERTAGKRREYEIDVQQIINVAEELIEVKMLTITLFPTTAQLDEWTGKVWAEACRREEI